MIEEIELNDASILTMSLDMKLSALTNTHKA